MLIFWNKLHFFPSHYSLEWCLGEAGSVSDVYTHNRDTGCGDCCLVLTNVPGKVLWIWEKWKINIYFIGNSSLPLPKTYSSKNCSSNTAWKKKRLSKRKLGCCWYQMKLSGVGRVYQHLIKVRNCLLFRAIEEFSTKCFTEVFKKSWFVYIRASILRVSGIFVCLFCLF